jgi:dTDP-4-dehydrorhamnose 3,5-epimerase
MEKEIPRVQKPLKFKDNRGCLWAYDDFDLEKLSIKRVFQIEVANFRGWHGHQLENNWFKVCSGMLKILIVKPDHWEAPSFNIKPAEYILSAEGHDILHIPAGYASAIKPLKENSVLEVFSDKYLEESLKDDYRFDGDRWYYDSFM